MLSSFLYVVRIFYKISRKLVIVFYICNIVGIPLLLGELFFTKYFIDTIQNITGSFDFKSSFINMTTLLLIIYASGIISGFGALCESHIIEASFFEKERLIIEKTLKLTMIDLDSPNTKTHREKAMKIDLHTLLFEWVYFYSDAIKIILLMLILFYFKLFSLIILIMSLMILHLFINKYAATKIEKVSQKQVSLKRLINYLLSLLVDRENIKEIIILKIDKYLKDKLAAIFNKNLLEIQKIILHTEVIKTFLNLFFVAVNLVVIIALVLTVSTDIKSGGQFILLYQIVNYLFSLVSSLSTHYSSLSQLVIQYHSFLSYLQNNEESIYTEYATPGGKGLQININNLSFSYPDSDTKALNGILLNIKAGEKVAFVGDNGSGKSTLVKIIMGLYVPSQGVLEWSLNDKSITRSAIASKTRVVFQDYAKLHRPIRENIALGDIRKINNDSDLVLSLEEANINEFSKSLDKIIGPEFGGADLSGGQWQRIAIARAYLNQGSLLIYDEATSALDPESELKAFNSFLSLANNKTAIIVTHKLSMTRFVDKIAVIDKGAIAEYGTHQELLKENGKYAKMYNLQSALFTI